jgi:hypothetical protein
MEFYIEPSPVPGQRIPYPTLSNIDEELDLSVVVPVRNLEHDIRGALDSIVDYFSNCPAVRYEVLVVDICSSDQTHNTALAFALEHDGVRILKIPQPVSGSLACAVGCLRTRGRWIFLFNPLDRVPITEYASFEECMRSGIRRSRAVVVAGRWRDAPENYAVLRSTFNALLESLTAWLLCAAGVKERACRHARTFMITREAARVVYSVLRMTLEAYDIEVLVVAAKMGMKIKTVQLQVEDQYRYTTSSAERIGHVLSVLNAMLMHSWSGKKRNFSAARERQSFSEV